MSLEKVPNFLLNLFEAEMDGNETSSYRFNSFLLNVAERQLFHAGTAVSLTPKAFDVLVYLVVRGGHLVHKDELMQAVWPDSFVEEGNLSRIIHTLRRALGEDDGNRLIETIPKSGYRFLSDVQKMSGNVETCSEQSDPNVDHLPDQISERPLPTLGTEWRFPFGHVPKIFWIGTIAIGVFLVVVGYEAKKAFWGRSSIQNVGLRSITASGNIGFPALSPDGRLLALVKTETGKPSLWIRQNSLRNSEIRLTEPKVDEIFTGVVFSPDGSRVYFLLKPRNNSVTQLYSVPIFGGEAAKSIINDVDSPPAFSPDGKHFAFMRRNTKEGVTAVIVANNDGTDPRELIRRTAPKDFSLKPLAWSPDGRKLVCFGAEKIGNADRSLVLIDADQGKELSVSDQKWVWVDSIVWTKNRGLVFSGSDSQKPLGLQLWAMDGLPGTANRVTNDLNDYSDLSIATETDAISALQAQWESLVCLVEPSAPESCKKISPNKTDGSQGIAWTPDGDLIYTSVINNRNSLQRMSISDMSTRAITDDEKYIFRNPAVSPDGRYIVFTSNQEQPETIWRMGIDGHDPKRLVDISGDMAAISPNGQTVYFSSSVEGRASIWSVSIDAALPKKLSEQIGSRPKVSPDGGRIAFYFRADAKAPWQIAVMRPDEDKILLLLDLPKTVSLSSHFAWSSDKSALILIDSRDALNNLWSYPLDRSAPEQVTRFVDDSFNRIVNFSYSPDGRQIALTRGRRISDAVSLDTK